MNLLMIAYDWIMMHYWGVRKHLEINRFRRLSWSQGHDTSMYADDVIVLALKLYRDLGHEGYTKVYEASRGNLT